MCAGLKRRRSVVIALGLVGAVVASPAFAKSDRPLACGWQPVVHGLRHLQPPSDLEAEELHCGIADPVDLSPEIATTIEEINDSLRAAPEVN
jgi:hypothetical protein